MAWTLLRRRTKLVRPSAAKVQKLIVCHDMMGGYVCLPRPPSIQFHHGPRLLGCIVDDHKDYSKQTFTDSTVDTIYILQIFGGGSIPARRRLRLCIQALSLAPYRHVHIFQACVWLGWLRVFVEECLLVSCHRHKLRRALQAICNTHALDNTYQPAI